MKPVPTLLCPRAELRELSADAGKTFWPQIAPAYFSEVQSGLDPAQATAVRLAWDESELRVLFDAVDALPWATHTQRDGPLWEEEVLEVFLDPVGDALNYFEIEVNPLGAVVDLVCRKNRSGYTKDFAWDCAGLRTAVRTTAQGWSAELAIPFASLIAEPPRAGSVWRANFCRIDRPNHLAASPERELTSWSPTHLRLFHVPERFGRIEFTAAFDQTK